MCYDIKVSLESQLRRAEFISDEATIKELKEKLKPFIEPNLYHASGYAHPSVLIYPDKSPFTPVISVWGLIPAWVRDNEKRLQLWNNTLNARGESIFDKPSFRDSAKHKRCVIVLDGFFEHHHAKGKTYPFFIRPKEEGSLYVAGLWSEWLDKETGELVNSFTIVTTKANKLLSKIHNNPKLNEPRMPLILEEKNVKIWLAPLQSESDKQRLNAIIKPFEDDVLKAYPVQKLRGKAALGNVPEAVTEVVYPELELELNE